MHGPHSCPNVQEVLLNKVSQVVKHLNCSPLLETGVSLRDCQLNGTRYLGCSAPLMTISRSSWASESCKWLCSWHPMTKAFSSGKPNNGQEKRKTPCILGPGMGSHLSELWMVTAQLSLTAKTNCAKGNERESVTCQFLVFFAAWCGSVMVFVSIFKCICFLPMNSSVLSSE